MRDILDPAGRRFAYIFGEFRLAWWIECRRICKNSVSITSIGCRYAIDTSVIVQSRVLGSVRAFIDIPLLCLLVVRRNIELARCRG